MAVSPNGYTDDYGPNVANILAHGSRAICGRVPASVRKDLRRAVKDGVLGHMPKDGLLPADRMFGARHTAEAPTICLALIAGLSALISTSEAQE